MRQIGVIQFWSYCTELFKAAIHVQGRWKIQGSLRV